MIKNKRLFILSKKLRMSGKSYLYIKKITGVPESTLSDWFSETKWSEDIKKRLTLINNQRSSNFLTHLNRLKRLDTLKKYDFYRQEAAREYNVLKTNPLFLIGISIYWGEGEKTENGRLGLINSDDEMIEVATRFFREVLEIPEEKLRAAIFLYLDNNKEKCLKYWANKTGLSEKQFNKTQLLPSRRKMTQRRIRNGICKVYFTDVKMNIKIKEWIRLLALEMRV